MFRFVLPVAVCFSNPAVAQDVEIEGLSPKKSPETSAPICENIPYSQQNCVRVLACMGDGGEYFDGQARGWDQGIVQGVRSNGIPCAGHWKSGRFGGTSTLMCQDGMSVDVLYYTQDGETGTVIGRGGDSAGRSVLVWTGENVLMFLTPKGQVGAELPCGPTPIPIS